MAISKIPIMDVMDEIIVYEKGNLRFMKQGNVVSFYAVMNNLGSGTDVTVGTCPEKYRPIASYALNTLYKNASPYPPVGSIWISRNGPITLYKDTSTTSAYVCGSYIAAT